MALKPGHVANFETLKQAALNGDLGLMECQDAVTGEYRAVICAGQRHADGSVTFVPFGHLSNGNPYNEYTPPEGGGSR